MTLSQQRLAKREAENVGMGHRNPWHGIPGARFEGTWPGKGLSRGVGLVRVGQRVKWQESKHCSMVMQLLKGAFNADALHTNRQLLS